MGWCRDITSMVKTKLNQPTDCTILKEIGKVINFTKLPQLNKVHRERRVTCAKR